MRVSVVIPCFNSSPHIVRTVESALNQTRPPAEIICVDDASTDGTWEILQNLAARSGGVVKTLRHTERKGTPAAGRNTAIGIASGDWIAFLDHDDLWLPNKLEAQALEIGRNAEAGMIHSECWTENDDNLSTRRLMHEDRPVPSQNAFRSLFHRNFVVCLTAMVRRDWIERCGPMNERAEILGSDDYDYWLRLAKLGYRFAYVAEPLGIWRGHAENASKDSVRALRSQANVVESLLAADPRLKEIVGEKDVRTRLLYLHLELASRMMKAGQSAEAERELKEAWRIGRTELAVWWLRAQLALKGGPNGGRRIVKKTARRYREKSREAGLAP